MTPTHEGIKLAVEALKGLLDFSVEHTCSGEGTTAWCPRCKKVEQASQALHALKKLLEGEKCDKCMDTGGIDGYPCYDCSKPTPLPAEGGIEPDEPHTYSSVFVWAKWCDWAKAEIKRLSSLSRQDDKEFTIEEMRRAVRAAALMGIRGVLDQDAWKREWNDESLADKIVNRLEGVKP